MTDRPITCALDRLDADEVARIEPVFSSARDKVSVDMRLVRHTTPGGVALLARLVRHAQQRSVNVEFVSVSPQARRALVAAGLHHLVSLSE